MKQLQHCLVATCFRAQGLPLGSRAGLGRWTQCQAGVPHAGAHRTGAGASAYKESTHGASLQSPRRTAYGHRTLTNALLILIFFFFLMFRHKLV